MQSKWVESNLHPFVHIILFPETSPIIAWRVRISVSPSRSRAADVGDFRIVRAGVWSDRCLLRVAA